MTQKCGGRPQTEEQIHAAVMAALELEAKREARRLGHQAIAARIDVKNVIEPNEAMEKYVPDVKGTNSLSATEWCSMESAMPAEEQLTHKNLSVWMQDRAKALGVKAEEEGGDEAEEAKIVAMLDGVESDDGEDDGPFEELEERK